MKGNQSSDKSAVNFATILQYWLYKSIYLGIPGNTHNLQISVEKISGAGGRLWGSCFLLLLPWRAADRGYQLVLARLHFSKQGDIKALCFAKLPGMFWGWGLQTASFVWFSPRDITKLSVIMVLSFHPAFLKLSVLWQWFQLVKGKMKPTLSVMQQKEFCSLSVTQMHQLCV